MTERWYVIRKRLITTDLKECKPISNPDINALRNAPESANGGSKTNDFVLCTQFCVSCKCLEEMPSRESRKPANY